MSKYMETDYVTVTRAARELGVGRNEMHRIPVERRKMWGEWFYLWGDIKTWIAKDTNTNSLLQQLRAKMKASIIRKEKRQNPNTKTGKLKKRFWPAPLVNCPVCGGQLKEEYELEEWFDDDVNCIDTDNTIVPQKEVRGGKHVVPVTHKGRKGTHFVTLDLDQEKTKQSILDSLKPVSRYKTIYCPIEDCGFSVQRQLAPHAAHSVTPIAPSDDYDDHYNQEDVDFPQTMEDDIRAMTSTIWSMEDGTLVGDIDEEPGTS